MKTSDGSLRNAAGNALFLILIAVALFAALAYAVTQSGRGSGSVGKEQLLIDIARTLDNMSLVQTTVDRLLVMGCGKLQISYQDAPGGFYTNAMSPADSTCHVFRKDGGGLSYTAPPASLLDSAYAAGTQYGRIIFAKNLAIDGTRLNGTVNQAHHILVPYIKEEACLAINKKLHNHNAIPRNTADNIASFLTFAFPGPDTLGSGVYIPCPTNGVMPSGQGSCGGLTGCFKLNQFSGFPQVNILYQLVLTDPP